MKKLMLVILFVFICSCASYGKDDPFNVQAPNMMMPPMVQTQPKVVKFKIYHHNTIAIIWYDMDGDEKADMAEMYTKKDGYYILEIKPAQMGDEADRILEPHI